MQKRILRGGLAAIAIVMAASCSEQAGSGRNVATPSVVVNCTSAACRTNASVIARVSITLYNCDPDSDQFASVASSMVLNCTVGSGCFGTASSWVDIQNNSVSQMAEGTYTVCGRIDYNNNYPSIRSDDSTASLDSVSISASSSGPITLSTWVGP